MPRVSGSAKSPGTVLKHEYGLKYTFANTAEARLAVKQAIDVYNNYRPHLSLNYLTPNQAHKAA